MRSAPEQPVATGAHEVFIQPAVRPRRNPLPQRFLALPAQLPSAGHATRFATPEVEFVKDERQLLWNAENGRKPKRLNLTAAKKAAFHQKAVGREDYRAGSFRFMDQFVIVNVRAPPSIVPGCAQPPG